MFLSRTAERFRIERTRASLLVLCVLALLAACSAVPREARLSDELTVDMLLAGEPVRQGEPLSALPDHDMLAVSEDMDAFLSRYVQAGSRDRSKLNQLLQAILNNGTFGLHYTTTTRTAAETYAHGNGNCMAFTNMFVAMARHVGLKARFQVVDVPPSWNRHGDTLVFNRHMNVLVDVPTVPGASLSGAQIVDFNVADFKSIYPRKVISDKRARAHYYSNLGVERLQEGDNRGAFLYLRKGLQHDQRFAPLWINLGVLYSRVGRADYAEASYLVALSHQPSNFVVLNNLARLYERTGQADLATSYSDRVAGYRRRNPYYRYFEAQEALLVKDYRSAEKHLRYAIRAKPEEDAFYFLLGMVHLEKGQRTAAQKYLEQARQVAADKKVKQRYSQKIRALLEGQDHGNEAETLSSPAETG